MSHKNFTLNWDLHKCTSDTNWTPESSGSQLANWLVHCCHGNIIWSNYHPLPPSTASVFVLIKAEAPLARKSTPSATSWRETSLCKGTNSQWSLVEDVCLLWRCSSVKASFRLKVKENCELHYYVSGTGIKVN